MKDGYAFSYQPGPAESGQIKSFILSARPTEYLESGVRSYFTDESFVIRVTAEDRAATAADSPY